MSKLDEMSSELQENSTEQPVEEKPFDSEEFLNSRTDNERDSYEGRVQEIAEERGVKKEDLIEADAYMEKDAREGAGIKSPRSYAEKVINSDVILDYPDDDKLLLKGNIDGKNYEIKASPDGYGYQIIDSKVDGEPLDSAEAVEILKNYANVAASRDRMIDKLEHETNNANNE